MRIMVGVNTLESVEQAVYSNHCQLWYHLGRKFPPPEHQFVLHNPRRMSIDRMRNSTAKLALETECDYLLFIDDDIVIEPVKEFLSLMIEDDKDIVAGWTLIRGYPFHNMIFKYDTDNHLTHLDDFKLDEKDPLVKCDAVGFSCCLIKCDLLKKVTPPYFVTGPYNTEDIYFCIKAKEAAPETSVYFDPRIITYHALGTEYISPLNRDAFKKYMLEAVPEMCQEDDKKDRGDEYLERIR